MRTTPSPAARRGPSRDVVRAADRPHTHRSRLRADRVGPRTAAALIAIALIAGCSDSGTIVEPASQSEFADPGPYPVAEFDVTLVDPSRPTRPNRTFPGTPDRTLIARVWFPTDGATGAIGDAAPVPAPGGPFPLIGYSHGYVSARVEATDLARHLASHGYVVVAPDYPLGNGGAPGGPTLADLAMQPGDLGFVMDGVARLPGKYGALSAAIDGSNRGIAGLSMGGATTLIAAYHPALGLEGVRAAVAFAPLSCLFGEAFYARSVPTLILSGDADELIPFATGPERALDFAPAPLLLARLHGGNHLGFIGLEVPGVGNTDRVVGCAALAGAGVGGLVVAAGELAVGPVAGIIDQSTCGSAVCEESFVQTMRASRQVELTRIATLAHFESELRGRADAALFLRDVFGAGNDDVDVRVKD